MRELPSPTLPLVGWLPWQRPAAAVPSPLRRLHQPEPSTPSACGGYAVSWASDEDDVRDAQRLRHLVFVQEMGAQPQVPHGTEPGLDADEFDRFCAHLLVRTVAASGASAEVIGTYRVLTPGAARRAGGFYSDTEFDLTALRPLQSRMAEFGRACVHPAHRQGGVILLLWSHLARFMTRSGLTAAVGCASIPMRDGGHHAASLWRSLQATHLAPAPLRVTPRLALPVERLTQTRVAEAPALIKGYLRCGAQVLGAPAWDPHFNTADLPMLLQLDQVDPRYRRHFMPAH